MVFAGETTDQAQTSLSEVLVGIVAQELVRTPEGEFGRTAALEVLINNPIISELIKDGDYDRLEELLSKDEEGTISMQTAVDNIFEKSV